MKKLLLVIDAQNDFVNDLTRVTLKKIEELVKSKQFTTVAFTKFINSNDNRFYKDINYKGCLTEDGVSIAIDTEDYKIFNKNVYTALTDEFISYLKNESITKPDKFHIHHQLLNMKFSHRKTVFIICFIDALFAITSIVYVLIDRQLGYLLYGILMLLVLAFVLKTNVVVEHKKSIFDKIKKI